MGSRLFTAVAGDILDTMGLQHQFLPPQIRALRDDVVAIGRAMPVLEADFFAVADEGGDEHG
jgi:4-hydroxy-4-methyl-2-oxoglutarate aldolase